MRLRTRLTERFEIEHPIISAPMGMITGGRLAAAVSNAGGLGLIGGGYGDGGWLEREFSHAGNAKVGCGFITWSLAKQPELLDSVLARQPAAVMLSFGPVAGFAAQIRQSGVRVICQVQSGAENLYFMRHASAHATKVCAEKDSKFAALFDGPNSYYGCLRRVEAGGKP